MRVGDGDARAMRHDGARELTHPEQARFEMNMRVDQARREDTAARDRPSLHLHVGADARDYAIHDGDIALLDLPGDGH